MRYAERIITVENLMMRQAYLKGCQFRVRLESQETDRFIVTFEAMTQEQLNKLRAHLDELMLRHIEVRVKVLKEQADPLKTPPYKRRKRRHKKRT